MRQQGDLFKWTAIALYAAVNLFITLALVRVPAGSEEMTNTALYKGASVILGVLVLWLGLRTRRYWLIAGFAVLQLAAFHRFSEALNAGGVAG